MQLSRYLLWQKQAAANKPAQWNGPRCSKQHGRGSETFDKIENATNFERVVVVVGEEFERVELVLSYTASYGSEWQVVIG